MNQVPPGGDVMDQKNRSWLFKLDVQAAKGTLRLSINLCRKKQLVGHLYNPQTTFYTHFFMLLPGGGMADIYIYILIWKNTRI